MSQANNNINPQDYLLATVTYPAFIEKVAADTGISQIDHATADTLLGLSNTIVPAVAIFLEKRANAETYAASDVIKEAAHTAFSFAGLLSDDSAKSQSSVISTNDYMNVPGVKEAAAALLIQSQAPSRPTEPEKKGNFAGVPMTPPKPEEEEEEEEEHRKNGPVNK